MNRLFLIAVCLVLSASASSARSWRGIVPLHSTREDVRRLLGKPSGQDTLFDTYKVGRDRVNVLYSTENIFDPADDCDSPLRYWWGYYHVPVGTVLSVTISFDKLIPLTRFKIPNFRRLTKGEPDDSLTVEYFDGKRGIEYSVQDRKIIEIEYGPSDADAGLRCAPDPEADVRQARVTQLCRELFGPMIDERMGLFAVNQFYVLHLTFDRRGELIALRVEPKHHYDFYHVEWGETEDFRNLSKTDFEHLLSQVDQFKPRGTLVMPASSVSLVTNFTVRQEEIYANAKVTWGEVSDRERPVNAPVLVRWFDVFYITGPAQ